MAMEKKKKNLILSISLCSLLCLLLFVSSVKASRISVEEKEEMEKAYNSTMEAR